MPIDVYAAMRAMMRAEAARRPVTPRARTADPSPPSPPAAAPAAPAPVDATVRDTSAARTVPDRPAAPRPVRRARPAARCLARCRALLRAVRDAVSSCCTGRTSRQGR
ncbi:hypothetical protein IGW14_30525 [Streptomyces hygroscopicus subsp. hygroscopicus]|uniref:hypothetical protein n=1 Tax=Streptomyces TaxID=1883 RepID=UPI001C65640E|nr:MULTISPECIES: hypothetical protein [Streptomyces]MBW8092195.1 hypothetical protein [Streptomyces hygroscopicus subsp. hygroscopicus]MDN3060139.1 hypothetical protein [Streptomyces sp. SRF1]